MMTGIFLTAIDCCMAFIRLQNAFQEATAFGSRQYKLPV